MPQADTIYAVRWFLHEELEHGRDNTISCPVYSGGALVVPTSPKVSVLNASGEVLVDAADASVVDSIATYTIPSATLADQVRGDRWMVRWSLTLDGVPRTFDNEAMLVRRKQFPVVADADLIAHVRKLDPNSASKIHSRTDLEEPILEAFKLYQSRLIAAGNRPNLVTSPTAGREFQLYTSLGLLFEDLSSSPGDHHAERAERYMQRADDAWNRMRLAYDDTDDQGTPTSSKRRPARRSVWLGGAP